MILCASPDQKEMHKTISTLEYGAKAKCIVRGPVTPVKDAGEDSSSTVILGSRIAAMDEFILKLQRENKLREKERNEAHKLLTRKEEEVSALRARLDKEEEKINSKVNERTESLKAELEKKLKESRKMANEFVEMERKRMEEKILQQQQEVEMLRRRLQEIESELRSKDGSSPVTKSTEGFARKLLGLYGNTDDSMVKSMELDMDDVGFIHKTETTTTTNVVHDNDGLFGPAFGDKVSLSTVYEEEEGEEDEEIEKKVIEENRVEDGGESRLVRIQNIFTLCGNQRELSKNTDTPVKKIMSENIDPQVMIHQSP